MLKINVSHDLTVYFLDTIEERVDTTIKTIKFICICSSVKFAFFTRTYWLNDILN